MCGGSDGISIFQNGAPPPAPSVLASYGAWVIQGCYVDSAAARSLPIAMAVTGGPTAMTVESCLNACATASYPFAGLEYSDECYCGSTLPAQVATDGRCNMICSGDSENICGGPNGLTVYQYGGASSASSASSASATSMSSSSSTSASSSASATPTGPTTLQTYGNWLYQGCYRYVVMQRSIRLLTVHSDDPGARSLSFTANLNGITTPQRCMDAVRRLLSHYTRH